MFREHIRGKVIYHFLKPLGTERRQFLRNIKNQGEWECTDQEIQQAKELIAKPEEPKQTDESTLEIIRELGIPERPISLRNENCTANCFSSSFQSIRSRDSTSKRAFIRISSGGSQPK